MSSSAGRVDLQNVTTHFQPIVELNRGNIIGYEALTRGAAGTPLESPRALFAEAERTRSVLWLEEACWTSAIESAVRQESEQASGARIFINALPGTLLAREFERVTIRLCEQSRLDPSRIVIEISEETRIDDFASFRAAISSYRIAGFGVAIDDAGAGHSGLQMMAEIVPDLIKIDAGLIREVDQHKGRRATIEALLMLARTLAIDVVAEGIEREEELQTLRELGVQLGQGYLLGRPSAGIRPAIAFNSPDGWRQSATAISPRDSAANTIGRLASHTATVQTGVELRAVVSLFEAQHADGVVIVDDAVPLGLVMKAHAYQLLGRAYGRDVYLRRPAELAAARRPLIVDHRTPLEEVSRLAMAREASCLYDHIIVTSDGDLLGIVSVQRLLAAITEARVDSARNANPLTGLPGNSMIERELRSRIRESERVALMHIDLDDFKAFNDAYGFHRGDHAITMTAELLVRELETDAGKHFLGHIGGDDFLAVVEASSAQSFGERIIAEFDRCILALYDDADAKRGSVRVAGRADAHEIPVMTLSVATSFVEPNDSRHYAQLLDALSAAKRESKLRKRERRQAQTRVRAS